MGLLSSLFCLFILIIMGIETRKRRKKKEPALDVCCKVGEERLLVYEYMKYGSQDMLHDRKKVGIKLIWTSRKKIAIGAARGLVALDVPPKATKNLIEFTLRRCSGATAGRT